MPSPFYVTTPIYYINDVPHLGTAYTTIAADVLARYHRLRGEDVRFLTGTDEHGLKIQRVAEERGIPPQAFADELSASFRSTWPRLGIAPDDFIRTTEERHTRGVQELWRKIEKNGDLYLGHYEGLYCVGCEAYYTDKDLDQPGNRCKIHGTAAEAVKEESYFFRLSRYQAPLLDLYASHPQFVQPATRRNEVKSFVEGGLQDLSVSRTTFRWGVPVPGDERHVMYVWFDALSNYLTALAEPPENRRFWPPNVQLVGKDIIRFHCVYWPAFLLAAGYTPDELPRQIFAHGFLTYGGRKMSKSLRNTVSPADLAEAISPTVGVDAVRYCLMRAISFGLDGDFSIEDVLKRYSSELGNTLGNLLNRVLPFADAVPAKAEDTPLEERLAAALEAGSMAAARAFDEVSPTRALEAIWGVLAAANEYVDKAAPWAAKKTDPARLGTIVATVVELLEAVSVMVAPVMPKVADLLREQLGLPRLAGEVGRDQWPHRLPSRPAGAPLRRGVPIFPRLEKEKEAELVARFSPPPDETAAKEAPAASAGPAPAASTAAASAVATATTPTPAATSPAGATAPSVPASPAAAPEPPGPRPVVEFGDFTRLDLRVGLVLSAEKVKKKDKLLDLRLDTGDAAPRRIIAGLAAAYAPEALVGKSVVVLCNLAPRDFGKGLVSEGMVLAAESPSGLCVLSPDAAAPPGTPIR